MVIILVFITSRGCTRVQVIRPDKDPRMKGLSIYYFFLSAKWILIK